MSLINQAVDIFLSQTSDKVNVESSDVTSAFESLLPTKDGDLDISSIVSQFSQIDLGGLVTSFLGDGQNINMLGTQVMSLLGQENIMNFASKLGIDADTAAETLSNVLPALIDKNSSGGGIKSLAGNIIGSFFS